MPMLSNVLFKEIKILGKYAIVSNENQNDTIFLNKIHYDVKTLRPQNKSNISNIWEKVRLFLYCAQDLVIAANRFFSGLNIVDEFANQMRKQKNEMSIEKNDLKANWIENWGIAKQRCTIMKVDLKKTRKKTMLLKHYPILRDCVLSRNRSLSFAVVAEQKVKKKKQPTNAPEMKCTHR